MPLQMANHEITDQHREVAQRCLEALDEWRAFIIGVDGWTGSGKSTLARFLAWQLDMPCVETDFFLVGNGWGNYDLEALKRPITERLEYRSNSSKNGRPVIVEGVSLLHTLKSVGLRPDFLIYAQNNGRTVGDSEAYLAWMQKYEAEFQPLTQASFVFHWTDD